MIFSESFGKSVLVIYRLGKSVLVNLSFGKKCPGTDIFLTLDYQYSELIHSYYKEHQNHNEIMPPGCEGGQMRA